MSVPGDGPIYGTAPPPPASSQLAQVEERTSSPRLRVDMAPEDGSAAERLRGISVRVGNTVVQEFHALYQKLGVFW